MISLSLQGSSGYPDSSLAVGTLMSAVAVAMLHLCILFMYEFIVYSLFGTKVFFWCNFNTQYAITYEYSVNLLILFPHMDSVDS